MNLRLLVYLGIMKLLGTLMLSLEPPTDIACVAQQVILIPEDILLSDHIITTRSLTLNDLPL